MTLCRFDHLPPVGITGVGHALPLAVRDNQAAVYGALRKNDPFGALFHGYETRRVLGPEESLAGLMAEACRAALASGRCGADGVDLLTGHASVGEFVAPSELFSVHRHLALGRATEVLPVADEFAAFLSGTRLAAERVWTGSVRAALVACGCRWTSNVDYADPVSVSIGDGAGAALVRALGAEASGDLRLRLLGWNSEVPPGLYGAMRLCPRRQEEPTTLADVAATTRPLFNMLAESERVFRDWGVRAPPQLAADLLTACGVDRHEVTCIAHQASGHLLDAWRVALAPVKFVDTIATLGNMTLASIPVTLSLRAAALQTRFVLFLGLGLGIHASTCLFERSEYDPT